MSARATTPAAPVGGVSSVATLDERLQREIVSARARVDAASERRQRLSAQLKAARAAEDAARETLATLLALLGDTGESVGGASAHGPGGLRLLSGSELREMIARVGLRRRIVGQAAHWSAWWGWLKAAHFDAAGKKPEATFLTQLGRCPLIRRDGRDGFYLLDVGLFTVARDDLSRLHAQLAQLPPPDQLSLLGDMRARRQELQAEVTRAERVVEEMWRVLSEELPPGWPAAVEVDPGRVVDAWDTATRGDDSRQQRFAVVPAELGNSIEGES